MIEVKDIPEIEKHISENEKVILFIADLYCSTSGALDNKLKDFTNKHPEIIMLNTSLAAIPTLAANFMVFAAPMLILFIKGKEIYREGRFLEFEKLEEYLTS